MALIGSENIVRCSCGSFNFITQNIVTFKEGVTIDDIRKSIQDEEETKYVVNNKMKYICANCGRELK